MANDGIVKLAEIFVDALGDAAEADNEDGDRVGSRRSRELQNVWAEILALAEAGKIDLESCAEAS